MQHWRPAGAPTSSASSSNSQDLEPVSAAAVKNRACGALSSGKLAAQLEGQASSCQLKMFELLGADARTMLWFAQSQQALVAWPNATVHMAELVLLFQTRVLLLGSQPGQLQQMPRAQRQLDSQLLLLLSAVLLRYAVESRNNMLAIQAPVGLCKAMLDAAIAIAHTGSQRSSDLWLPGMSVMPLLGIWTSEVLPTVLQLTDHCLQLAARPESSAADSATNTTTATSHFLAMEPLAILLPMLHQLV